MLFIEPGGPCENGYGETCNGKLREELLSQELFYTSEAVKALIETRRREGNTIGPPESS